MRRKNILRTLPASAVTVSVAVACLPAGTSAGPTADTDLRALQLPEGIRQNHLAPLRQKTLYSGGTAEADTAAVRREEWLRRVKADEVDMVTNRHKREPQKKCMLHGRVYYVSGDAHALNMRLNPSTRFAKDPLTDRAVDKSGAVIYADASGRVYYFESEATYSAFMALAERSTVAGYTPAR